MAQRQQVKSNGKFHTGRKAQTTIKLSDGTLVERQKIVVPVAICVSAHISRATSRPNDADVGTLTGARVRDVERVCFRLDAGDHFFTRPLPAGWVSQMRDVLVRTVRVRLRDTRNAAISHSNILASFQVGMPDRITGISQPVSSTNRSQEFRPTSDHHHGQQKAFTVRTLRRRCRGGLNVKSPTWDDRLGRFNQANRLMSLR